MLGRALICGSVIFTRYLLRRFFRPPPVFPIRPKLPIWHGRRQAMRWPSVLLCWLSKVRFRFRITLIVLASPVSNRTRLRPRLCVLSSPSSSLSSSPSSMYLLTSCSQVGTRYLSVRGMFFGCAHVGGLCHSNASRHASGNDLVDVWQCIAYSSLRLSLVDKSVDKQLATCV